MELNREQIIKALEICTGTEQDYYCTNIPCPYGDVGSCKDLLMAHAFALIKELTEEKRNLEYVLEGVMHSVDKWLEGKELEQDEVNRAATMREKTLQIVEKLTEENKVRKGLNTMLNNELRRLGGENERLKSVEFTCGFVKPHKVLECPIFDEIAKAKADTVRKMQERLTKEFDRMHKSNFITVEVRQWIIDQIAKEMLEGQ